MPVRVVQLTSRDIDLARSTFAMMASVFEEPTRPQGDDYLTRLLGREDFIALVALEDAMPIGGATAHVLPLTRAEASELFIYDIAVRTDRQRSGVGRQLLSALRMKAAELHAEVVFVAADDEDDHALEFYRALGGAPSAVTMFTFGPSLDS